MAADRAINMALRVLGIGEVERDFKRVGSAGTKSFAEVEKSANGAAREVSEYTARLKRAAAEANRLAANTPDLNKGSKSEIRANQRDFKLGFINAEKERILQGLPGTTEAMDALGGATDTTGLSLARLTALGAAAGSAVYALGRFALDSLTAFEEHEAALTRFNTVLALGGNLSDATGEEIAAMAARIAAATGQTEESALKAAAALARIPGMTRVGLEEALSVSAQLAVALGEDVAESAEKTGAVLVALADRDIKALYKATEDLSPSLRLTILNLAEAGRTAEAQTAYFDGLRAAIGDDSGGVTAATNRLSAAWDGLKTSFGENISSPVISALNSIAGYLDLVRQKAAETRGGLLGVLTLMANPGTQFLLFQRQRGAGGPAFQPQGEGPTTAGIARSRALLEAGAAREVERRFGEQPKVRKPRGGGRRAGGGGKSDAQREAEKLAREAQQAREAADRIAEANADVTESYRLRASEAAAKVGLEGAALDALERRLAVETAARKLNAEAIDKEVAARKAEAAASRKPFDEAKVTADVTAAVQAQAEALREQAGAAFDADRALEAWKQQLAAAKAILGELETPLDRLNAKVDDAIAALRAGALTAGQFDNAMKVLADDFGEAAREADKAALAWEGFGQDVGRAFSDIILNGGSARDILQQLLRLPLERLLFQNVEAPIADFIDGLTGNNRDKNAAKALGGLPDSQTVLGASVSIDGMATAADRASSALSGISLSLGAPVDVLGAQATAAGQGLGALVPLTGQFGGVLGQLIAQLSAGGGGGGSGLLGLGLQLAGAALGGGAGPLARLSGDVNATIAANPGIFAAGTDSLPVGRWFDVGENGRERMRYHGGGRLEVMGGERTRRAANDGGGGMTIVQNITVPKHMDPRRTASSFARQTQGAIGRAARKGLAMGPGR